MSEEWNSSWPIPERAKVVAHLMTNKGGQDALERYIQNLEDGEPKLTKRGKPIEGDELREWIEGLKACLIL